MKEDHKLFQGCLKAKSLCFKSSKLRFITRTQDLKQKDTISSLLLNFTKLLRILAFALSTPIQARSFVDHLHFQISNHFSSTTEPQQTQAPPPKKKKKLLQMKFKIFKTFK